MNTDGILILVTGGTLDKDYNPISGELAFDHSHLPQILNQANCTLPVSVKTLMLKDSLEMTDNDREFILEAIQNAEESRILVTHGTDTMCQTGEYLLKHQEIRLQTKTIVLTGAMRPFKLGESDASFNLGAAIMALQLLDKGIYLCMNGRCHPAGKVQKNLSKGMFEKR